MAKVLPRDGFGAKMDSKREPKWSQNGAQNISKIVSKGDPERGRKRSRKLRGKSAPTGWFWSENGSQMGSKKALKTIKKRSQNRYRKREVHRAILDQPGIPTGNLISCRLIKKIIPNKEKNCEDII